MSETPKLPTIDDVLRAPYTRTWLKQALRSALDKDPVDAANDAALLNALLQARARKLLNLYNP